MNVRVPEPVGFVVALPEESRTLVPRRLRCGALVDRGAHGWITVSGAGAAHATRGAERLIERGVKGLIAWGCAGGLHERLAPGDLVLARELRGADGVDWTVDAGWHERVCERLRVHRTIETGAVAEAATVIASPRAKAELRESTGAIATDMESVAVIRTATAHGLPALSIRAIADPASMALPAAITHCLDRNGDVDLMKLLLHLLANPRELTALLHLRRCFGAASASLRAVVETAGPTTWHAAPPGPA